MNLLHLLGSIEQVIVENPVVLLAEIIVAYFVIKFLKNFFAAENNVPTISFEVPKPQGGKFKEEMLKQNKDTIVCYNPASLELLGTVPVFSPSQVAEAAKKARTAQKKWANTTFAERRRVLRTIVEYVATHGEEISTISREETGKTVFEGIAGEVLTTCSKLLWTVDNGEDVLKSQYRPSGIMMPHKVARLDYMPYGVIGIIIPWNFPIHNALSHIGTAIMAGNGTVVKVSEWGSWSVTYLDRMLKAVFKACGHDPDLVQFVTGFGETGSAVVSNTDKILFIGSPEVGKKVMETASKTLTPVVLELGGKDPYIVCEDAPFDHAVNMAVRGAFFNCGQNCISAERFFVYEAIYDKFVNEVVKTAKNVRQGYDVDANRCDIGSINLPGQLAKYQSLVDDAVSKGATVLMGGKTRENASGHFFEPTILVNVNSSMRIMKEEIFGPILCMIKVTNDEQVIQMANDCAFGLGCSIFTTNYKRADRMAKKIESGMCVVNDWGLFFTIIAMPFGGVKHSGFGRFNGPEGLLEFVFPKTFVTDRFPIVMKPPSWMNYPVKPKAHLLFDQVIKMLFARGLITKTKAVLSLTKRMITNDI